MTTTAQVHRRKLPNTGMTADTRQTVKSMASDAVESGRKKLGALRASVETAAAGSAHPSPRPARPKPTLRKSGAAANAPVKAASCAVVAASSDHGNFSPDPVIASLAERAANPMAAPSWKSFRMYASNHPGLKDFKSEGVVAMMHTHQGFRLGVFAISLALVILLAALLAYWWLMPAKATADSPYVTAEVTQLSSTPVAKWKAGTIPSLYQSDADWGSQPYGQATLADAGAAPTALAMAYVAVTGDTSLTPADFAAWATDHDLTASGTESVNTYLNQAASHFGLKLSPLDKSSMSLRRAIVSNIPVLVVTQPGTFAPTASVVVLDDIDGDSRIVLHDPTSASRSNKSWSFDDILNSAAQMYTVSAA